MRNGRFFRLPVKKNLSHSNESYHQRLIRRWRAGLLEPLACFEFDAPEFPTHCLPEPLDDIVTQFSKYNGAPVSINATVALTALSGCAGRRIIMTTLPGYHTRANLYTIAVLLSGLGKTITLRPWMTPIYDFERRRREQFEDKKIGHKTRIEVLEEELKTLKGGLDVLRMSVKHRE